MLINKDTKIYGSFSLEPGNNGCRFFNEKFEQNNINAIYKSFYSNNIKNSVQAARNLGFSGFAVSAPFKKEVLEFVEGTESPVEIIGAANTIINVDGCFVAHNTDWIGVKKYFIENWSELLYRGYRVSILGDGGFSMSMTELLTAVDTRKYSISSYNKKRMVPYS